MRAHAALMAGIFAVAICPQRAIAQDNSVLTYHGDNGRSGNFVVAALSWEKARSIHLAPNFDARVAGVRLRPAALLASF